MKTSISFAALALLSASAIALSATDGLAKSNRNHRKIPSWYLGLTGGVSFVGNAEYDAVAPAAVAGQIDFDEGLSLSGVVGYRPRYTNSHWDNVRFEFELGYFDNEIGSIRQNGATQQWNDDMQVVRMMANFYYDMDATTQVRPYVGFGLGAADIQTTNDSDTVFAYQGMAGVYYTPSSFPLVEFGVGYRYFTTQDPTLSSPASVSQIEMDFEAHSLEAGLRAYF